VIDSILGTRSMMVRNPIAAPTSAPEMRSIPFWIVAPSLPRPTIRHVMRHVRMPGQSRVWDVADHHRERALERVADVGRVRERRARRGWSCRRADAAPRRRPERLPNQPTTSITEHGTIPNRLEATTSVSDRFGRGARRRARGESRRSPPRGVEPRALGCAERRRREELQGGGAADQAVASVTRALRSACRVRRGGRAPP
jgi:hypothetical protein